MGPKFNVFIGLNVGEAFDRRAFDAIATVANEYENVRLIKRMSSTPLANIARSRDIHGIILQRVGQGELDDISRLGLPFVSVADLPAGRPHQYVVAADEAAIGRVAAQHFLDAGFCHFAVFARPSATRDLAERIASFRRTVEAAGHACAVGPTVESPVGSGEPEEVSWDAGAGPWIASLPKPLAVFGPHDYDAKAAVNAARDAGLQVPDQVAVVGVDDDITHCMTVSPNLSSVVTPGRQVGLLAFATLLRVLQGRPDVPKRTLVPPPTVVVRGSSSDRALDDPDLIAAVRFIRETAGRGVTVGQVAEHVLLSRRTLERRFIQTLSHTIRDEIRIAKVGRAKRLLIDTDLPYAEVAQRSGLVQQQQMNRLVKAATGMTPAQFRKNAREHRAV